MLTRIALLSALLAGVAAGDTVSETIRENHPLNPDGVVRVDDVNGAIAIGTWDRPEVSVVAEKTAPDEDALKRIVVTIESDSQHLRVKAKFSDSEFHWWQVFEWPWNRGDKGSVAFTLKVPAGAALERISTVNGAITIEGAKGKMSVHSVNGPLHVKGLEGGTLETVNGSIHAEVARFDSGANLRVSTVNGAVELALPAAVGADLHVSTVNGGVSSDFPGAEKSGSIVGHHLSGEIGGGGGDITVSTVNGGVKIRRL